MKNLKEIVAELFIIEEAMCELVGSGEIDKETARDLDSWADMVKDVKDYLWNIVGIEDMDELQKYLPEEEEE